MTVHIQTSPASNLVLALLCPSLLNRQPSGLEYGPVVLVEQMVTVGDVIRSVRIVCIMSATGRGIIPFAYKSYIH